MPPKPLPKLRKDGQPKRSGRPPKDPTKEVVSRRDKPALAKRPPANKFAGMEFDDLDDLIGTDPIAPAPETVSMSAEEYEAGGEIDMTNIHGGVTITWLSEAFQLSPATVRKKLANCPVKFRVTGKFAKYDLPTAASYLIKPRFDVGEYIKTMKPHDLPPILQAAYWDAQKKRQDWELNAGDLWPTDKVVGVLADTFKLFKTTVSLFTDTLEQEKGLTDAQRETLGAMCDGLMDEVHNALVRQHQTTRTPNQKDTLIEMEAAASASFREPEDDDEQI